MNNKKDESFEFNFRLAYLGIFIITFFIIFTTKLLGDGSLQTVYNYEFTYILLYPLVEIIINFIESKFKRNEKSLLYFLLRLLSIFSIMFGYSVFINISDFYMDSVRGTYLALIEFGIIVGISCLFSLIQIRFEDKKKEINISDKKASIILSVLAIICGVVPGFTVSFSRPLWFTSYGELYNIIVQILGLAFFQVLIMTGFITLSIKMLTNRLE